MSLKFDYQSIELISTFKILREMPRQIFFIHNAKCGGQAVRKTLLSSEIDFIGTETIDVEKNIDLLQMLIEKKSDWLIFGHPGDIKIPSKEKKELLSIYLKLLNILYTKTTIIMASRDPVDLFRSWMHYYKTRVNNHIEARNTNFEPSKLSGMKKIMLELTGLSQIPSNGFWLDPLKESDNLYKFLEIIESSSFLMPAWSQTHSLFFRERFTIRDKLRSKEKFHINCINKINSGDLFIYNSSQYTDYARAMLDEYLGKDFSNKLHSTRINRSKNKPLVDSQSLENFEMHYKRDYLCEFEIFNCAK